MVTLTFDKIQKINERLKSSDTTTLNEALGVLETDMKLRRELYGSDCLEELYHSEDLLPQNLHTPKPRPGHIVDLIYERMRVIILSEYRRLHRLAGLEFINKKITYDDYVQRSERYAIDASKIWPS